MAGKLQNEDFKTEAELTGAGGSASQLLNDTKIYVTANSINKTLDDAITDGDIGSGAAVDVAYIQDYKTSGSGGTFTSGSWQTRTLNTLTGGGAWVSLSSNQITLQPGKYAITGFAPAYRVNANQARFQNVTDATTSFFGGVAISLNSDGTGSNSPFSGFLDLASAKTFEVQHICNTTVASFGFGLAVTNTDVFTQLLILKLS